MASSKVTVSMDRAHLKARMQKAKDLAGYAVASQIQADCRPFTPHAEGILEASSRVESTLTAEGKEYSITWNTVQVPQNVLPESVFICAVKGNRFSYTQNKYNLMNLI